MAFELKTQSQIVMRDVAVFALQNRYRRFHDRSSKLALNDLMLCACAQHLWGYIKLLPDGWGVTSLPTFVSVFYQKYEQRS